MSSLNRRFRKKLVDVPVQEWVDYPSEEPQYFEGVDLNQEEAELDYWCCCGRCMGYDDGTDLLEWVEKVRPWVAHGGNPLMDLMEGLDMPEHERPAHGWTTAAMAEMGIDPTCHCGCCGIEYCDTHRSVGGDIDDWYEWAEELAARRNNPLHQLYEALTPQRSHEDVN
jgi:hypothetical protein